MSADKSSKTCLPFFIASARSFAKDFGLFSFHKKERSKCILPTPRPSTVWKRWWYARPAVCSEAVVKTKAHINIRKKTATASFVFTIEKKTVALPRYALCLISGFPVVQPRFAKLSNPHFRRWNISRFKDGFQKYINERMMVLWFFKIVITKGFLKSKNRICTNRAIGRSPRYICWRQTIRCGLKPKGVGLSNICYSEDKKSSSIWFGVFQPSGLIGKRL